MSTSLKTPYANEIAEAMVNTLKDKEFMGLYKKAEVDTLLEQFNEDLDGGAALGKKQEEIEEIKKKIEEAKKQRENESIEKYRAQIGSIPEPQKPPFDFDKYNEANDEEKETIRRKYEEAKKEQKDKAMENFRKFLKQMPEHQPVNFSKSDDVVVAFTLKNLTKLANALDVNGYSGLANIVDRTLNKIASLVDKKAFDVGIESIEESKREDSVVEIKKLLDEGKFSEALSLLSNLDSIVEETSDLYSTFTKKEE